MYLFSRCLQVEYGIRIQQSAKAGLLGRGMPWALVDEADESHLVSLKKTSGR
ncbi:hypothetical protein [Ottowia sp.]|uniref:hypothetical protein n=1 Tax=Ottowia sp. TaxID=1898956 RepID=UPI003C76906B